MFYARPARLVPRLVRLFGRPARRSGLGLLAALLGMAGCGGPRQQSLPETAALEEPAALCERIDAVLAAARDTRRLDASVHGAVPASRSHTAATSRPLSTTCSAAVRSPAGLFAPAIRG